MNYHKRYLYQRIVNAKAFIETNYHTDLNLDTMVIEAHFSKYHFLRLFKSIYGLTPHQFLIEIRIKMAKIELTETNKSVTDVCMDAGFQSLSSFIHLFKRKTGRTPLQYRKFTKARRFEVNNAPLKQIPGCYTLRHLRG